MTLFFGLLGLFCSLLLALLMSYYRGKDRGYLEGVEDGKRSGYIRGWFERGEKTKKVMAELEALHNEVSK